MTVIVETKRSLLRQITITKKASTTSPKHRTALRKERQWKINSGFAAFVPPQFLRRYCAAKEKKSRLSPFWWMRRKLTK